MLVGVGVGVSLNISVAVGVGVGVSCLSSRPLLDETETNVGEAIIGGVGVEVEAVTPAVPDEIITGISTGMYDVGFR